MTEVNSEKVKKRKPNQNTNVVDESSSKLKKTKVDPLKLIFSNRFWSRTVFLIGLMFFVWYKNSNREVTFAKQSEIFKNKGQKFNCDKEYLKDSNLFPECIPKGCGRFVTDKLITASEVDILLKIAQKGFSLGGSDGGASIFDLHSGALSFKTKFINVLTLEQSKQLLSPVDVSVYKLVKSKIQHAIANSFDIDAKNLYLTKPTFFSKLTSEPPVTEHDKYWLPHIDKETYGSFHYTSLLYLSDYGIDFKGGRLNFVDEKKSFNVTIEPRKGRVAFFTSGAENLHFVERVTKGIRYAITISFTCNNEMKNVDTILGINL